MDFFSGNSSSNSSFLVNNSFNGTLNYEYSGFVAIVNQTVAQGYWPGKNPIGKHIARDAIQREVVRRSYWM